MIPFALRAVQMQDWPAGALEIPRLQAHRGYWAGGFRENTLAAFRAAKAAGFSMAELDVRLSRDGQVVVYHDDDLSAFGRGEEVRHVDAVEMARISGAPLLRDVLCDAAGPESYNIEVKAPVSIAGRVEPAVAQVIREARAQERVLISSFNPLSLALVSELLPEVPRALLATSRMEKGNSFALRKFLFAPFLKVHMLNLDDVMMTPEMISFLRSRRLRYSVWTVNDAARARELLETGAVSVITDRVRPADLSSAI